MTKIVAFIFARGGSKGLPGKNIMPLNGKPLIAHSIDFAKACPQISDVIVSTDSPEIAEVAKAYGAKVPFLRPPEISHDTAPEMLAWQHAAGYYREHFGDFDVFLSLPVVSPLRKPEDTERVISTLLSTEADFVMSAVESDANPYSNLIERRGSEGFKLCLAAKSGRRQDVPKVFRIIPMYYACRPETVFRLNNLFDGKVEIVEIERARAADVDTAEDFKQLETLYQNF